MKVAPNVVLRREGARLCLYIVTEKGPSGEPGLGGHSVGKSSAPGEVEPAHQQDTGRRDVGVIGPRRHDAHCAADDADHLVQHTGPAPHVPISEYQYDAALYAEVCRS